jgi:dipeptidyl aminopeptidase/acylaminoacyl peptidase
VNIQAPRGKAASGLRVLGLLAAITLGVVLVLALTSAGWPGSSRKAASGPRGTIAAGGAAVYLISPATGVSRRVPTPAPATRADLSEDGRRIAVAGLSALWVMNRDGSRPQRILRAAAADVAWSPGGSRLAIVRNGALLTISADGSDSKKVTGRAETPHWYPGGKWIVFVRNPELSSRNGAISAIRPDGGGLRRIVPKGSWYGPRISPDGSKVAFYRNGLPGIFVAPLSGGEPRLLVRNGSQPVWSPGGRYIAFTRDVNCGGHGACRSRVYVMPASGGTARPHGPVLTDLLLFSWSR